MRNEVVVRTSCLDVVQNYSGIYTRGMISRQRVELSRA